MDREEVEPEEQQHPLDVGVDAYGADIGSENGNAGDSNPPDSNPVTDSTKTDTPTNFIVNLHGLPYSATHEDISKFLEGCTIVGGEKGIHFVLGDDGRRNGDAFVELESDEDLKKAQLKNREHIGKRYIDVFQVDRYEMQYILRRSGSESEPTNGDGDNDDAIVRLRGLPYGCTKEEIATFFLGLAIAPNGIVIVTDQQGRAAGDGFVRFTSPDLVDRALEKHKEKIGHRYIEVFRSSIAEMQKRAGRPPAFRPGPYDRPDYDRDMGYRSRNVKGPYGGGYGGGYSSSRYESSRYGGGSGYGGGYGGRYGGRDSYSGRDRYGSGGMGGYGGRDYGGGDNYVSHTGYYVHMRGLPYSATDQDIIKFFSPLVPAHVAIEYGRDGRPSGNANVDFDSEMAAKEAMKKHKAMMEHRYIELSLNGAGFGGYRR